MVEAVRFAVLGPLEVDAGSGTIVLPAAKQRALLAVLLCQANERVSVDRLFQALWADDVPPAASDNLRQYVLKLRRALGDASRIEKRVAGYSLRVEPGEVDADRFDALAELGRDALAAGDVMRAVAALREALALWRGPAYADLDEIELLRNEAARLDERRLTVLEARVEIDLSLGWHAELVPELSRVIADNPLRERFRAQLMIALYRSGRQSEALQVYRDTRRLLADELGLEPGSELRGLERRILVGDPDLDHRPTITGIGFGTPSLLPADIASFVGRRRELGRLDELRRSHTAATAMVISAIAGTAGVGKTALAVRWAHRIRSDFPDGQLFVNMRGYDPEQPLTAADALAGFLRALGVRGQDIPATLDDRAARYRSELAGRRMLVLLDNAASVQQIRPLLPGTPGCLVIVTSRDSLTGLVALNDAQRLELDLLSADEGIALLRELVGSRVEAEPEAAGQLVALCARLPLALRLAAELAAVRPSVGLGRLAAELADHQRRLDLLDAQDDARAAVRTVFSWSYRHLSTDAARVFRLLGLHPGPHVDVHAAGALTGAGTDRTGPLLTTLGRAHLLQPVGADRWAMHDLLRAYAAELAATEESQVARRTALGALFGHYMRAVLTATAAIGPAGPREEPPAGRGDAASGWAWLDAERPNLVAVCGHCAAHGWDDYAISLAGALSHYLDAGGHFSDAELVHGHACAAAARTGNAAAHARALANLARAYRRQGRLDRATDTYQRALALYAQLADRTGQAHALRSLGSVCWRQGRYPLAADCYRQALTLCRQDNDIAGQAEALRSLGLLNERLGRQAVATAQLADALDLYRRLGDGFSEAHVLSALGRVQQRQDQLREAAGQLERNLVLVRQTGDRTGEAYALTDLAGVYRYQDRLDEAVCHLETAVTSLRDIRDRASEAEALNDLGAILHIRGSSEEARTRHTWALNLAKEIGDRYEQARAHDGIAAAHRVADEVELARRHWRQAMDLYAALGVRDAEQVRAQLRDLPARAGAAEHLISE
jgi:DNA-binding SARP family transcriptional activator/Tfp pilus assembly protein PilF